MGNRKVMSPDRVLVGLHLAKTGGTSLHAHAKGCLPDRSQYYVCGVHEDAKRIMMGNPILSELDLEEITFAFGHNLLLEDALLFSEERLVMFTIIRDPFHRFVSQYKHYFRTRTDSGRPKTALEFLEDYPTNPTACRLEDLFGRLAPGKNLSKQRISNILKNIDLVLTTERLDESSPILFEIIGMPGPTERSRVYPERPNLEGITPEYIYELSPIDKFIHDSVKATADWRVNPFGFDPDGRRRCRDLIITPYSRDHLSDEAYSRVFGYFRSNDMLPALREVLAIRPWTPVARRLDHFCESTGIDPTTSPRTILEEINVGKAMLDSGEFGKAAEILKSATERHPDNFLAHYHLARALKRTGPNSAAQAACRRAIALNSTNQHARNLLAQIVS